VKRWLAVVAALFCIAAAPDPADRLPNPDQEARARHLFKQTRCVVCQNESIDDSQAELAHDLRQVIRGQIAAGRSDEEIRTFLVSRYGDFILLRPRFSPATVILWVGPFAIVLIGLGVLAARRRKAEAVDETLTPEEEARLKSIVERSDNL
jgi:cytochrome c-type biogenesis protein CcmH